MSSAIALSLAASHLGCCIIKMVN